MRIRKFGFILKTVCYQLSLLILFYLMCETNQISEALSLIESAAEKLTLLQRFACSDGNVLTEV